MYKENEMLEYKMTPEQKLLNAIENDPLPPLPPSCSLDRYNKEDLRMILSDWILIYNEVCSQYSQRGFDRCYVEKITNGELIALIKGFSHKSSLTGGTREAWKSVILEDE
jgi:hypothetical protein